MDDAVPRVWTFGRPVDVDGAVACRVTLHAGKVDSVVRILGAQVKGPRNELNAAKSAL